MKKLFPVIAALILILASCDKYPSSFEGRYFGKFSNTTAESLNEDGSLIEDESLIEDGSLIFQYETCDCHDTVINGITVRRCAVRFCINNFSDLKLVEKYPDEPDSTIWHFPDTIVGDTLKRFLKHIPALDSIHICKLPDTIKRLNSLKVEFKGNSVKANFHFTTSHEETEKNAFVEFIGYNGDD